MWDAPPDEQLLDAAASGALRTKLGLEKQVDRLLAPDPRARAVVRAVTFYNDPDVILEVSRGLGEPMRGIEMSTLRPEEVLATRGW